MLHPTHPIRRIAEECIIKERPVGEVAREMRIKQKKASMIKNSHRTHILAIEILRQQPENRELLKRITPKQIAKAVELHVNELMTVDEIDDRLRLRQGTCRMLTRSELWKKEKYRLTHFGAYKEGDNE